MGDMANVRIKESEDRSVFLYAHWSGHALAKDTQKALQRKVRWDDKMYLARIIFDQMTEGRHGEETGYGITTQLCDNKHPIITLSYGDDDEFIWLSNEDGSEISNTRMTFSAFIEMDEKAIDDWYQQHFRRKHLRIWEEV